MKKTLWILAALLMTVQISAFAQPMEEEEEPVQARPNPMEQTTRGAMMRKASDRGMQRGKALGTRQHVGPAATTATGKASDCLTGHKCNADDTEGLMPRPDAAIDSKAMKAKGMQNMHQNKMKSMGVR